jgi:hypothetical protein
MTRVQTEAKALAAHRIVGISSINTITVGAAARSSSSRPAPQLPITPEGFSSESGIVTTPSRRSEGVA